MNNEKIHSLYLNIKSYLQNNNNEDALKCKIRQFIHNEFKELELLEDKYVEKWGGSEKKQAIMIVVANIMKYNIKDISWKLYCEILYSIFKDKELKVKIILKYMSEIFLFIINNTEVVTEDIIKLRNYKEIFESGMRFELKACGRHQENKNSLYGYLWLNSKIDCLYIYDKCEKLTIVNINTNNIFIRKILVEFIEKNLSGSKTYKLNHLRYKQFIYYFEKSLSRLKILPNDITDFTFDTFKEQYRFYRRVINKTKVEGHNNSISVLKEFYIFLIDNINENNIAYNIFSGTAITREELINHNFNSYYEKGYTIIDKSGFSEMPKSDRWAIKSDSKASSQSYKILVFDFTEVKNKTYRDDLKNYVWYQSTISNTSLYSYFPKIISFLNYKDDFDKEAENFIFKDKLTEFSLEFLMAYKIDLMLKYLNQNSRIGHLKAIRKFLLYHKKKYEITKLHLAYITVKKDKGRDINPVTNKDFSLLAEEFTRRKNLSILDELYYIIFNLKSTTRLRIGEILNIERDSIDLKNKNNNDSIHIFTKTEGDVRKKIYLTKDKVALIKRAKELTEDLIVNSMSEDRKYVFILENKKFKLDNFEVCNVSKIQNNRFREAFKEIQETVLGEIKYTAYNLRQMYKSTIYNEGSKENISIAVLEKLTGTKYRTDIKHYILSNDINLYAEVFSGVTISNVNISGEIIKDDEIELLNPVENGLGGCKTESCEIDGMYKCLTCTNFATAISRKNKFKERIEANKSMIQKDISDDERNYLISENKLYAAYYAEIIHLEKK